MLQVPGVREDKLGQGSFLGSRVPVLKAPPSRPQAPEGTEGVCSLASTVSPGAGTTCTVNPSREQETHAECTDGGEDKDTRDLDPRTWEKDEV